jgi:cell division septation protein DedD
MKIRIVFFVIAAFFVFQSSSPWEGAAAVAPAGELPSAGQFIATNSFPRNTIVDITNIETNKSVRVIVANTLDSPGLLAIVSSEAAELIGLRPGSIGRIRMVQPTEPIAFMRFIEGSSAVFNGIELDNIFSEEELFEELYREDTFVLPSLITQIPTVSPSVNNGLPPYIVDDPEWAGIGMLNIVELPVIEEPEVIVIEEPEYIAIVEPVIEEPEVIVIAEPEYVAIVDPVIEEPQVIVIEEPEHVAIVEPVIEEQEIIVIEEPEYIAVVEPVIEEPEVIVIAEPEHVAVVDPTDTVFNLVETEEFRVPPIMGIYGIDPSLIIPGLTMVDPPPLPVEIPTPLPAPLPTEIPVPALQPSPVISAPNFSVNTISRLDRGQFYVQIGAFQSVNQVESLIGQIDRRYNPVVFVDGGSFYRVLIGPLNEGESAAILVRFRSIGYTDAFVRRGT